MSGGEPRLAPPAMVVSVAVGLGTMDMPIPQVATWEWVNWKFPKPVHAGETLYARWTLTQKRPPVHGSKTGIVVWRVDVHTTDGAMCAEGEVGAAVVRRLAGSPAERADAAPVPAGPARRRRRRRSGSSSEPAPAPAPAAVPVPAAPAAPAATAAERAPRRRRRRRPGGSAGGQNGDANHGGSSGPDHPEPAVAAPPPAAPTPAPQARGAATANPLSRALKRLRRT